MTLQLLSGSEQRFLREWFGTKDKWLGVYSMIALPPRPATHFERYLVLLVLERLHCRCQQSYHGDGTELLADRFIREW